MRDRSKRSVIKFTAGLRAGVTNFCQGLASTKLQLDPISGKGLGVSPRHDPTRPMRARQKF